MWSLPSAIAAATTFMSASSMRSDKILRLRASHPTTTTIPYHPSKHKRELLVEAGESSRFRSGSFANVFSLRCICAVFISTYSLLYHSRLALFPPMLSLGCWAEMGSDLYAIPDCVTGSQSDPLRNWSVLFLGFGELLLRSEGLVALEGVLVLVLVICSSSCRRGGQYREDCRCS